MHVAVAPELAHAPPHPDTVFPADGAAVRVTTVLAGNDPVQVLALQEMPLGLDVTVPAPVAEIVRMKLDAGAPPASCSLPEEPQAETAMATITAVSRVKRKADHLWTRVRKRQMFRTGPRDEICSISPPDCLTAFEHYTELLQLLHDQYIGRPAIRPILPPAGLGRPHLIGRVW